MVTRPSTAAPSVGPIETMMTADHVELDRLLGAAERDDGTIDEDAYTRFRGGRIGRAHV